MPLDGLFLHFLKDDIAAFAIGSKVDKIHQPTKDELVLLLRQRSGSRKLLISASANNPRIAFIEEAPENPQNPPMFCMLMRKHLGGAVLQNIRQEGLDRLLYLDFDCTTEIGQKTKITLCLELMPKHANIILVNCQGLILDAVKRIDFTKSEIRQILPSLLYEKPPIQDKFSLLETQAKDLINKAQSHEKMKSADALLAVSQGFSPLIAREVTEYAFSSDVKLKDFTDESLNKLEKRLEEIKGMLREGKCRAGLLLDSEGKAADFSFMPIFQYGSIYKFTSFEDLSLLLESFYIGRDKLERARQRSADLAKIISNAIARTARTLALRREELSKSEDREKLRVFAELISANQNRLENGALFYELENYYDENKTVRIPADPALSPVANSQKYYKAYRKAKNAQLMLSDLIERAQSELLYLETVEEALQRAKIQAEVEEIRAELVASGFVKKKAKKGQKDPKPLPPLEYRSAEGFKILVGRNNSQNDKLTFKIARKGDIWLHVQKIPGSHVIVMAEDREIPDATIELAAQIAAYHSSASESLKAEVDYTPVSQVKKPAGALPGKVIYHSYKTVLVSPRLPETKD